MERELKAGLMDSALHFEALAKINAPVDTGFLRNSIHVVAFEFSGLEAAQAVGATVNAKGANGRKLVTIPPPTDPFEVFVVVGADYGRPVEYGHFARRGTTRMSTRGKSRLGNDRLTAQRIADRSYGTFVQGRFYLSRALEAGRPFFTHRMKLALERAGEAAK